MSNEQDKNKHNTRMHRAWTAIKRQLNIIKQRKHFGDGWEYAIHPYDVYNFDRSYVSGYAIANPTYI